MVRTDYKAKTSYRGTTAAQYDLKRSWRKKWKREMAVIETLVASFGTDTSIIDIPVGTGRFLPFYLEGKHPVIGVDISKDMLAQASAKAKGRNPLQTLAYFMIGDAEQIPLTNKSMDFAICIRLLNWVTQPCSTLIIRELHRVARQGIVMGFRSIHPMSLSDFFRLGFRDILPTPRHLAKWLKKFAIFIRHWGGRIKRLLIRMTGQPIQNKSPGNDLKPNRTLYNEGEVLRSFHQLGWTLSDTFFIDEVARYKRKLVDSYSIYYFKFSGKESLTS
jgi:ubiquinone/menaquinone biosynthesis C-methylase UbiE